MKRTIILDANVIVSALFGGVPLEAVTQALREDVCFSPEVEAELTGLKERLHNKLPFKTLRYWIASFLPSLMKKMRRVESPPRLKICRDPKDDAYLSLAKMVKAECLITGDKDLLSISPDDLRKQGFHKFVIMTPRDFLNRN